MSATRVRFEPTRLLAAADLRDDVAFESRRRERHVRAAHRAWGIALGFSLAIDEPGEGVFVGPGLAYDRCGRELVSSRTVHIPTAGGDGTVVLVVRPPDAPRFCSDPGAAHEVGWSWRAPGCVADDEVPLAEFALTDGKVAGPELIVRHGSAHRRHARVGTGVHKEVGWQPDSEINVYTTAADFKRTPFYFATLVATASTQELFGPRSRVLGPWPELHSASKGRFKVTLRFGGPADDVSGLGAGETFEIHWIGVEPLLGCPEPELDPDSAVSATGAPIPPAPLPLIPLPPTGGSQPTEERP